MKFKTTGILILALAAALGYYFWSQKGAKPAGSTPEPTASSLGEGQLLIPLDAASVNQVSIIDPSGVRTTVRKTGDQWTMTEPEAAPASSETTRDLIDMLTQGLHSAGRPNSDPGSDSGLDKP